SAVDYPGPAALVSGVPTPDDVPLMPRLTSLKDDAPILYQGCVQNLKQSKVIHCVLGKLDSRKTIVLFGDSHSVQWAPTLRAITVAMGWRLVTFTKQACGYARVELTRHGKPYRSCDIWREKAIKEIRKLKPAIIFTSQERHDYLDKKIEIQGIQST